MTIYGDNAASVAADIELRRTRVSAGFARFYAPLAVLTFILTFIPYYEPKPDSSIEYGNLWQEVARTGHSYDVLAVFAFLAVIILLALAAVDKLGPVGLFIATACTLLIGILLWSSPGFSEKPVHSDAGVADIAACFLAAAILLSHAICMLAFGHALRQRRAPSA